MISQLRRRQIILILTKMDRATGRKPPSAEIFMGMVCSVKSCLNRNYVNQVTCIAWPYSHGFCHFEVNFLCFRVPCLFWGCWRNRLDAIVLFFPPSSGAVYSFPDGSGQSSYPNLITQRLWLSCISGWKWSSWKLWKTSRIRRGNSKSAKRNAAAVVVIFSHRWEFICE